MPKSIDDLSIFGEYGQAENRLTVALLQVLKAGGEELIRHFSDELGFSVPSSEIGIFSQVTADKSTPDGLLESNFRFSLIIESKAKRNAIGQSQLTNHLDYRAQRGENSTLIYLTPDAIRPKLLSDASIVWANWETVDDALQSYLQKPNVEARELLEFLTEQFHRFCGNLGALGADWTAPPPSRVLVVAAKEARGVARRYQVYWCQNRRSFKPSRWIAFYSGGEIDTLAEVVGSPEDDVVIAERPEFSEAVAAYPFLRNPHRLFRLRNVETIGPIKNDLKDRNGSMTAWTQSQRYTTIEKLRAANRTSDLK